MSRLEMAHWMDRLRILGQDVKNDYAGRGVGYRLYVRAGGADVVVLRTAHEAETLVRGLTARIKPEHTNAKGSTEAAL